MLSELLISSLMSLSGVVADTATSSESPCQSHHEVDRLSVGYHFREDFYTPSAARLFKQAYSFTSFQIEGVGEELSESRIPQIGKGVDCWRVEARSHFIMDSCNQVWGDASFEKGQRKAVQWNETSDVALLYPYIMADEKGGDLDYEKYLFNGGYAGRYKRWLYGATMGYRALNEYRTIDPRPNNVVADLKAEISSGFMARHYALTLGVNAGKYKQTNELSFYNELGANKEYHLTGIGNDYVRFSGACNNLFYKGKDFGTSIALVPTQQKGWSFQLAYKRWMFEKILFNLNRLPLNELHENQVTSQLGWNGKKGKHEFGGKGEFMYAEREGFDNIFGDAVSNVYPQLGTALMYKNRKSGVKVSGFYEYTCPEHIALGFTPYVALQKFESFHVDSNNRLNMQQMEIGGLAQCIYVKGRNTYQLALKGSFRKGFNTLLHLSENSCSAAGLVESLEHVMKYFSNNEGATQLKLRYQRALRYKSLGYFVQGVWLHRTYLDGEKNNVVNIATGITF